MHWNRCVSCHFLRLPHFHGKKREIAFAMRHFSFTLSSYVCAFPSLPWTVISLFHWYFKHGVRQRCAWLSLSNPQVGRVHGWWQREYSVTFLFEREQRILGNNDRMTPVSNFIFVFSLINVRIYRSWGLMWNICFLLKYVYNRYTVYK
jgi:hypothetical protein